MKVSLHGDSPRSPRSLLLIRDIFYFGGKLLSYFYQLHETKHDTRAFLLPLMSKLIRIIPADHVTYLRSVKLSLNEKNRLIRQMALEVTRLRLRINLTMPISNLMNFWFYLERSKSLLVPFTSPRRVNLILKTVNKYFVSSPTLTNLSMIRSPEIKYFAVTGTEPQKFGLWLWPCQVSLQPWSTN